MVANKSISHRGKKQQHSGSATLKGSRNLQQLCSRRLNHRAGLTASKPF